MSSIAVYPDTNCINSSGKIKALNELEKLHEEGKIMIEKTGVLDTELLQNPQRNEARLKKSDNYIESYDIAVLDHIRLGHSIVGSDKDEEEIVKIRRILFGEKASYTKQEFRDALHIHTVSRHGGYFITYDNELLSKSEEIKQHFMITVTTPEDCLDKVKKRLKVLEDAKKWRKENF